MDLQIIDHLDDMSHIKIHTDTRFCKILIDWLTPYIKREIKKASVQYECCSWREAFDQVLVKEDSLRADKFQIYSELIDLNGDWDLANINENI
jgi:hypothetical protein